MDVSEVCYVNVCRSGMRCNVRNSFDVALYYTIATCNSSREQTMKMCPANIDLELWTTVRSLRPARSRSLSVPQARSLRLRPSVTAPKRHSIIPSCFPITCERAPVKPRADVHLNLHALFLHTPSLRHAAHPSSTPPPPPDSRLDFPSLRQHILPARPDAAHQQTCHQD